MIATSTLEISSKAYRQNIRYIRKEIGPHPVISAVVKGNAYGHGIAQMVEIAEKAGIRHFSTFSSDEAWEVYNYSKRGSEIMILGMLYLEELEEIIRKGIQFYVFDFQRLDAAIEISKKIGIPARVHIEIETGFHRTGFEWDAREELASKLLENQEFLSVEGLCTHYAGAESVSNFVRVKKQITKYHDFKSYFLERSLLFNKYHTACSAATLIFPETIMDMVRIGIAGYGFWPTKETFFAKLNDLPKGNKNPLKRLITWKSTVMSIKKVKMGEFVGYGNSYMALENISMAIVPVGYGHGYSRLLSNQGTVLIQGQYCQVVGTVTMNTIAVDISKVKNVKIDDEVILIGKQKGKEITVASFSESTQQVNYELLTRLPKDIPRRIIP
ncbi:alanine racemase [Algoriphagus halophytocola]|uniref:Alanine racemase n=1 Tax=Algoriphagus halophytocola TaxID=2991499 RepID=A0ABY6MD92_9BACT|nr:MULTISPECIES: alanine racemase [unclassified Algoriphagus]UZD21675.1 alanine racemase [Algoriphagus sp. TR-M5]WBL42887.1 alanine racemase [Algoriphagus sp. TR-M9]